MAVEDDALHALKIPKHNSVGNISSVLQSRDMKRVAWVRMSGGTDRSRASRRPDRGVRR